MDTIIGKQVTHKQYGEGTIVKVDDNSIVVDFGTTKKKFILDKFLGFFKVDDEVSKVITEKIAANKRAKAAEKAREDAAKEAIQSPLLEEGERKKNLTLSLALIIMLDILSVHRF